MRKYLVYTAALAFMLTAAGCDKKGGDTGTAAEQEQLSANDMINNPNTANPEEFDEKAPLPVLTFEETEYDFGSIKSGDMVKHTFRFKNTGNAPLLIENASASCGCTVPNWPKEPIQPGGTGQIDVEFDSKGKYGQQSKQVMIRANTQPNITQLTIKGNIPGAPAADVPAGGPIRQ